jgi:hypothetical protein
MVKGTSPRAVKPDTSKPGATSAKSVDFIQVAHIERAIGRGIGRRASAQKDLGRRLRSAACVRDVNRLESVQDAGDDEFSPLLVTVPIGDDPKAIVAQLVETRFDVGV